MQLYWPRGGHRASFRCPKAIAALAYIQDLQEWPSANSDLSELEHIRSCATV